MSVRVVVEAFESEVSASDMTILIEGCVSRTPSIDRSTLERTYMSAMHASLLRGNTCCSPEVGS
jgi:hypothetical protein